MAKLPNCQPPSCISSYLILLNSSFIIFSLLLTISLMDFTSIKIILLHFSMSTFCFTYTFLSKKVFKGCKFDTELSAFVRLTFSFTPGSGFEPEARARQARMLGLATPPGLLESFKTYVFLRVVVRWTANSQPQPLQTLSFLQAFHRRGDGCRR